jgi:hypothetical protein
VPSAVSTVTWNNGQNSDLYAIDASTRQVIDLHSDPNTVGALTPLGGPRNVTAVSAAANLDRLPMVVALTADGSVYDYVTPFQSPSYWNYLGSGFTAVSATHDGFIFAVDNYGNVLANGPYGPPSQWMNIGTPGVAIQAISASRNGDGIYNPYHEEVFALGNDGHIYLNRFDGNYNPGFWQTIDSSKTYSQISANDHNTVYGLSARDGQITKESERYSFWGGFYYWSGQQLPAWGVWTPLGGLKEQYTQISAGTDRAGQDVVYAIDWY